MSVVAEEDPFAAVVDPEFLHSTCSYCFRTASPILLPATTMKRCATCNLIHYCSKDCQKRDWRIHKIECRLLTRIGAVSKSWLDTLAPSKMRLLCRVIIRCMMGEDTRILAWNSRTFDDLEDNYELIVCDPMCEPSVSNIPLLLKNFQLIEFPVHDVRTLTSYFGKIHTNYFPIHYEGVKVGIGIYVGLSGHTHTCDPEASFVSSGRTKYLISPKKDASYSRRLTISYVDLELDAEDRNSYLGQRSLHCLCDTCRDPEREAKWRALKCQRCAEGSCPVYSDEESIVCDKCGVASETTLSAAMFANEAVKRFFHFHNEAVEPATASLSEALSLYEDMSYVLSTRKNMNMARLAKEIVRLAALTDNAVVMKQFAGRFHHVYRLFLKEGTVELTAAYLYATMAMQVVEPTGDRYHSMVQETTRLVIASYGENRLALDQVRVMQHVFQKMMLQRGFMQLPITPDAIYENPPTPNRYFVFDSIDEEEG